jgi:integrase
VPRKPGPWPYKKFWVSSFGGIQKRKLCPLSHGKRAAEIILARLIAEHAEADTPGPGIAPRRDGRTVSEAIEEFLDQKKAACSEDGFEFYRDRLKPLYKKYGGRPLVSITDTDGFAYLRWLREECNLGNTTVNHNIRVARSLFRWAAKTRRRYLKADPWEELPRLPENKRERVLTDEEFNILLANCGRGDKGRTTEDFRDFLVILRYTGMRPGELRKLRWEYVNFVDHRIVFPADKVKTKSRRPITMVDKVEEILRKRGRRSEGLVFTQRGRQVTSDSLSQRFTRLVRRCVARGLIEAEKGGERIVMYTTRHSRGTELVKLVPLPTVMAELGHKRLSTSQRYLHTSDDYNTQVVREKANP